MEAAEGASTLVVLLLALLQGVAEFLPISSSGHLVLGRAALDLEEAGLSFDIALHVGTLLAVLVAYRSEVAGLLKDLLKGRLSLALWLVVASLPAAIVGIALKEEIAAASSAPLAAAAGLLVTSLLLTVAQRFRRGRSAAEDTGTVPSLAIALLIGLAQAVAIWPGISRSGSTIAAGLLCGLGGREAARLSFLMSLVAVGGAALLDLPDAWAEGFGPVSRSQMALGVLVSAGAGLLSLRLLLLFLRRTNLAPFAIYTALLGVATFWAVS